MTAQLNIAGVTRSNKRTGASSTRVLYFVFAFTFVTINICNLRSVKKKINQMSHKWFPGTIRHVCKLVFDGLPYRFPLLLHHHHHPQAPPPAGRMIWLDGSLVQCHEVYEGQPALRAVTAPNLLAAFTGFLSIPSIPMSLSVTINSYNHNKTYQRPNSFVKLLFADFSSAFDKMQPHILNDQS